MSVFKFKTFLLLCSHIKLLCLVVSIIIGNYTDTKAQIIPDRTLPNNSTVTNNGNTIKIEGGTVKGTNLFHSFTEFSIDPSNLNNGINAAYFNNASNITNIFSRVTGNSISQINGLIKNNGSADLFLINPNGIIFGENAALDIGGSFISSTADSIRFANGNEFSAVDPQADPLLTVNIPVGLQYGTQSGDITVRGTGNGLTFNPDSRAIDTESRPAGLKVSADSTLALIGGNVFLEGGNLTANAGNIEIGSVKGDLISLDSNLWGWELNYAGINSWGEISLSQSASIDVSGNSGGRVWLQGNAISLIDGSAILANTWGDGTAGLLNIEAEEINISGVGSGLFSLVSENTAGNGANIDLQTNQLTIQDGGQISVDTLGLGNGGNLSIDAREITLTGDSGIFAHAINNIGNGGDMAIATKLLAIENGAEIYAGNFSHLDDANSNSLNTLQVSPSSLSYSIIGTGEVGNINIDANVISLNSTSTEISSISTATYQQGGGIIRLNADTVLVNNSQILTETKGNSYGGAIYLNADMLHLNEGGRIITNTLAAGNAGKIVVATNNELIARGENSGIFSRGNLNSTGSTGDIGIVGNIIDFSHDSQIDTTNLGLGEDGTISLEADRSNVDIKTVVSDRDRQNQEFGDISVARFWSDRDRLANMLERTQTIDKPTELTVSTCNPKPNSDVAIDRISHPDSTRQNIEFWRLPAKTVASQSLERVYRAKLMANNSPIEAKSWIVNSEGKVELLASFCD